MSHSKIGLTLLLIAAVAMVFATPASLRAQAGAAVQSYTATVVNRSKGEIYFKIVGGKGKAFIEATLQPNYKMSQAVSGGDKVVCIWDSDGYLMAAWRLTVIGDCTINVPDPDPSKPANFSEPGEGVVDMKGDYSKMEAGSQAPSPSIERKPN